ncbi:hypothetical protein NZ698_00430 [Chryseobacterium sp. PBS4-4]|uniref:Uncharacterized protein n=1 Tax=Chryseobacterium edaphi TaxID=2976532 RepID=A0ABT2W073_9FLAO|nr:hypothetical protein [Chryseobacterium edaphi]MCU7615646.1 hypothetical protein [Chryseobacterium edaphi]
MTEIQFKGKKGVFKALMGFIISENSIKRTITFNLKVVKPNFEQILVITPIGSEEISKEDCKKIFDFVSESNK